MRSILAVAALAATAALALADGPAPSAFDPPPWFPEEVWRADHPHPNGGAWIGQGMYRNAAGELCCGIRALKNARLRGLCGDCFALEDADVAITGAGYRVKSLRETIPFAEALPSPDGGYWRCEWGGMRKCFFAPPPNS